MPGLSDHGCTVFYLAGRPVAQLLQIDATTTWTYLTTDHLGTPLLATDESGGELWKAAFEPFGRDPWQGTPSGALEAGIFLRFPGQWEDEVWQDAALGSGVYYNVYRWYETGTGRYTRRETLIDPELMDFAYVYAAQNPLVNFDPTGEITLGTDVECDNFSGIVQGLDQLRDNCRCRRFFSEELKTDLPSLLDQTLPYLYLKPTATIRTVVARPGKFNCRTEPDRIYIERKLCRKPWFFKQRRIRRATQITLHELAHFADCNFNGDRYPWEEGYAAEQACFGRTIGNPPTPPSR